MFRQVFFAPALERKKVCGILSKLHEVTTMDEKTLFEIIDFYYPVEDDLRKTLLKHSCQVKEKALELAGKTDIPLNREVLAAGAMLHDIGIKLCHAPGIFCCGELHYLRHGVEGAGLLRAYGAAHAMDLEPFALICERHTGSGLTTEDIISQKLPLPEQDFLPLTPEEKMVCLADKFFSKSGDMEEKSFEKVRRSMAKFGDASLARFDNLWAFFNFRSV